MFYDVVFEFYDQYRCDLTPHMYHVKHSIFWVPVKCVGVSVEIFSKNAHVWCRSVKSEKLLCTECAGVPKLAEHKYSVHFTPKSIDMKNANSCEMNLQ